MEKTKSDDTVKNYTDYVLRYFPKDALRLLEDRDDAFPAHRHIHGRDGQGHEGHEVSSSLLRRLTATHRA